VLHSRPYQESSLLLELFTQDLGRIAAIAKGAQRPKSKLRGILQSFTPLVISCTGKGELLTLVDAEATRTPYHLTGKRLIAGFYLNELLMRLLTRWDPHSVLFSHYQETLSQLEEAASEQKTLRLFEKNLLKELGYALPLTRVVGKNTSVHPDIEYCFDPEQGPLPIEQGGVLVNNLKPRAHSRLVKGSSLLCLAKDKLDDPRVLLDAKRILRQALSIYLGPKPLESRRLLII
jgi:DNA repair protein RecO (recombination protein O)